MYKLGRLITDWIESFSAPLQLLPLTILSLFRDIKNSRKAFRIILFREIYNAGIRALPLTIISGILSGFAIVKLFPYNQISFGIENIYGSIFSVILFRELAPLVTAIIVLIRTGVFITIQIGTMREHKELKILRILGINPIEYLGSVKLFVGMIILPVLATYYSFFAALSAMLTAFIFYRISPGSFFQEVSITTSALDIIIVIAKSLFSGIAIFIIAINFGLADFKFKKNLSSRVTRTIIFSLIAYAIFEFIISMGVYGF